jgi:hypothetical protein
MEDAQAIVDGAWPATLQSGLSYEDALLGQFELIACDAISVFLADDVVAAAPAGYLKNLYSQLLRSSEFEAIPVRIEKIPPGPEGFEFLDRFLGPIGPRSPIEVQVMRKKARIMEHWANKIGGHLVVG